MRFLFPTLILLVIGIAIFARMHGGSSDTSLRVDNEAVQKEIQSKKHFYTQQGLSVDEEALESEIRARLLEDELVVAYTQKNNITITDAELENRYKEIYMKYGSEEAYLVKMREQYAIDKDAYLEKLRIEILRAKVQEAVKKPLIEWLLEEKKKAGVP